MCFISFFFFSIYYKVLIFTASASSLSLTVTTAWGAMWADDPSFNNRRVFYRSGLVSCIQEVFGHRPGFELQFTGRHLELWALFKSVLKISSHPYSRVFENYENPQRLSFTPLAQRLASANQTLLWVLLFITASLALRLFHRETEPPAVWASLQSEQDLLGSTFNVPLLIWYNMIH